MATPPVLYGVAFNHPVKEEVNVPAGVPEAFRGEGRPKVLQYGRLRHCLWPCGVTLMDVPGAAEFMQGPKLCNQVPAGTFYCSAWKLFETDLEWPTEDFGLADLQPRASQVLAEQLEQCYTAVELGMHRAGGLTGTGQGAARDRQRLLNQHRQAITVMKELRCFQVWAVKDFELLVPATHKLRGSVPWSLFSSGRVTAPMLALKLKNSEELLQGEVLVPALRSMILNNVRYRISKEPVLAHTIATVGSVMTQGGLVNVFGDFTQLKTSHGLVPKNCVAWIVRIDDARFQGLWQELKERRKQEGADLTSLVEKERYRLWDLGETFGVASATQDLQRLRLLLPSKDYAADGELLLPDVLQQNAKIYVAFLGNVEKQQFQLKALDRGVQERIGKPLLELVGQPQDLQSMKEQWYPNHTLAGLRLSHRFSQLTQEQLDALEALLESRRALLSVVASAGTGKSFLIGALLRLWLDRERVETGGGLVLVATPRAKHRQDLLSNLTVFVPEQNCYILESGPDLEAQEVTLGKEFLLAATNEAAGTLLSAQWSVLRDWDAVVDDTGRSREDRIAAVMARTEVLWEQILWRRQVLVSQFVEQKLRVLVATSDKIRKMLGNHGSRIFGRQVELLVQDEFEGESLLDVAVCLSHFSRVITLGDPNQILKNMSLNLPEDCLPERVPTGSEAGAVTRHKVAAYDPPVVDFLQKRAYKVSLQKTFRLGPELVQFIREVFPEPFRSSLQSAEMTATKVKLVHYSGNWQHMDMLGVLESSSWRNFEWYVFTIVGLDLLAPDRPEQVGVISYYVAVLTQLHVHVRWLAATLQRDHDLANIHFLTPETAQGYTLSKVHYLALHQRKWEDETPEGQQLELGRRYVACTRAKKELWIWAQELKPAGDEWTRRLQMIAAQSYSVRFGPWDLSLQEGWQYLGFGFSEVDVNLLETGWVKPTGEQLQQAVAYLRRQKEAVAGTTVAAAQFFQDPKEWLECWGSMAWSQEERPLPSLHSFEQIHKKARTDVVQMDSGIFIPFVPIMQIGAESFLVPLQCWYGAARQHGQLDDGEMFAGILPVMLELGTRLGLQYRVEYHKLEYEELGRRIHFAQHCNGVRGACVLLPKRNAPETEV